MLETGRTEEAIDFLETALAADRSSGFQKGMADDLAAIELVCLSQDNNENAVKSFKRSIQIYALIGDEKKVNEIMEHLNKASEKAGLDISITKHFVKKWLQEKTHEVPCR